MPNYNNVKKTNKGRFTALYAIPAESVLAMFALASVLVFGLYYYWSALLAGAFLTIMLLHTAKRKKHISLPATLPAIFVAIAISFYLLSVFWAVDKGMALFGFLKYLPVVLFAAVATTTGVDKEKLLFAFAYAGGFSAVSCLLLGLFPFFNGTLYPNGRFSGTFQYANSYALFLLACIVIFSTKKELKKTEHALCAVMYTGIFLTGSRSLFVLTAITAGLILFINRKAVIAMASGIPMAFLFSWLLGITGTLQRSADVSFGAGEWLTRLAYYQDGIRMIAQHPFGLGHTGWWYMQPVTQTAVYNVRLIHSWPLQLALDAGMLPAFLAIAAAAIVFFSKGGKLRDRLLLTLILGHSLIDFNLAFLPITFLLVLLLPETKTVEITLCEKSAKTATVLCAAALVVFAWMGIASFFSFTGQDKIAVATYPFYTEAMEKIIATESNSDEAYYWASRIQKNNGLVYSSYNVKARIYANEGRWLDAVRAKQEALAISRLHGEDYDELFMYIHYAMQEAGSIGDVEGYEALKSLAMGIPLYMESVDRSMGSLAYELKHKPSLVVSEHSERFLDYLHNGN